MNPTEKELIDIIETLIKSIETWRGNQDYKRTLTVELFCVVSIYETLYPQKENEKILPGN